MGTLNSKIASIDTNTKSNKYTRTNRRYKNNSKHHKNRFNHSINKHQNITLDPQIYHKLVVVG